MSRELSYGKYRSMSSDQFEAGDFVVVKVAIVVGYHGDYAVYLGESETEGAAIAAYGDKLSGMRGREAAEALVPVLTYGRVAR